MELPVIIEPLPARPGFSARLAASIDISAEGATADEAEQKLAELVYEKLRNGTELRTPRLGVPRGGWLPDDELTREWLQHMKDYRDECDARDREELEQLEKSEEGSK
ncbi:MAG: hypothetical protein HYX68_17800 [Planctomycetes bacterium]|nr:hypothetical protein [Planctomycetota bacterium]